MKNKKGMTLIEVIVAVSIMAVVGMFVAGIIGPSFTVFNHNTATDRLRSLGNTAVDYMAEELQLATAVTIGTGDSSENKSIIKKDANTIVVDGAKFKKEFGKDFFTDKYKLDLKFTKVDSNLMKITLKISDDTGVSSTAEATCRLQNAIIKGTNEGDKVTFAVNNDMADAL